MFLFFHFSVLKKAIFFFLFYLFSQSKTVNFNYTRSITNMNDDSAHILKLTTHYLQIR